MANAGSRFSALRLDRRVYVLGSAGLVRNIGRSATFVFLPLVFADVYHLSYLVIGLLVVAIVPLSTFSFLAGGYLSDRYGRRPFAVFPSFVSAGAMLLLWAWLDRGVPVVMALWAVNAVTNGLSRPVQSAMIGDVTTPDLAVTAFGVQRVFTNVGFAISPAVGGFLAAYSGLPTLFLFAAITSAVEGGVLFVLLRETHRGGTPSSQRAFARLSEPFRDRSFLALLLALVGLAVLMNQFGTPLALYLGAVRTIPFSEFGLIYALNGTLVVLLQLPISRLVERRHLYLAWMATGSLAYGVAFLVFDVATVFPLFLLAMAILTIGEDIVSPTEQSLVSRFAGPEKRGSYFGAYNAGTNIARVVGPLVGTLLLSFGTFGPTVLWVGMFGLSIVVALAFLGLRTDLSSRLSVERESAGPPLHPELGLSGRE